MKNIAKFFGMSMVATILISGMGGVSACRVETELIAGQHTNVGNVEILHAHSVDSTMTITYTTSGDWILTESHVAVACSFKGIPQTNANKPDKTHNPKVGKFQYSDKHGPVESYAYTIDLDDYDCITVNPSNGYYEGTLYIAIHGVVEHPCYGEETAWADTYGIPFNPDGNGNWALYLIVTLG